MIVNVRVKNIRPEYNNLKEWMDDINNVYIGRKGIVFIDNERFPKEDSEWCNPFKISDELSRVESLEKYRTYLQDKIKNKQTLKRFNKLKGKNLGCWCHPESCHGDIIMEFLNN